MLPGPDGGAGGQVVPVGDGLGAQHGGVAALVIALEQVQVGVVVVPGGDARLEGLQNLRLIVGEPPGAVADAALRREGAQRADLGRNLGVLIALVDDDPAALDGRQVLLDGRAGLGGQRHADPFGFRIVVVQLLQVVRQPVSGVEDAGLTVEHQRFGVGVALGDELLVQQAVVVQAIEEGQGLLHVLLRAAPDEVAAFILHPELRIGAVASEQAAGGVVEILVDHHAVRVLAAAQLGLLKGEHDVPEVVHRLRCLKIQPVHPVLAQPDVGEGIRIGNVAGDTVALAVIHGHLIELAAVRALNLLVPGGEVLVHHVVHRHDQAGLSQLNQIVLVGDDEHVRDLARGDGQAQLLLIALVRVVLQPQVLDFDVERLFGRGDVAVVLQRLAPPVRPGCHVGLEVGVVVVDDGHFHRLVIRRDQRALAVVLLIELLQVVGQQLDLRVKVVLVVLVHSQRGDEDQAEAQRQRQGQDAFHGMTSFSVGSCVASRSSPDGKPCNMIVL